MAAVQISLQQRFLNFSQLRFIILQSGRFCMISSVDPGYFFVIFYFVQVYRFGPQALDDVRAVAMLPQCVFGVYRYGILRSICSCEMDIFFGRCFFS